MAVQFQKECLFMRVYAIVPNSRQHGFRLKFNTERPRGHRYDINIFNCIYISHLRRINLKIQTYGSITRKELTLLIWPLYLCLYWDSSEIFERINAAGIKIWIVLNEFYNNNNDKTCAVIFIYFNVTAMQKPYFRFSGHRGCAENNFGKTGKTVDLYLVYLLSLCTKCLSLICGYLLYLCAAAWNLRYHELRRMYLWLRR
jgi:hypothetical protein